MKKVDTYGLKINGLRKVCGETNLPRGYWDGFYMEIFYDKSTGALWTDEHVSHNNYSLYKDEDVVKITNAYSHMTMQRIANAVRDRMTGPA